MKIVVVGLLALVVGCAGVYRYEANGVTAYGELLETGEPLYYSIGIDLEEGDGGLASLLAIQFASSESPWQPPEQWPDVWKQREIERLEGYQVFSGEGAYLKFRDGRLSFLGLCSHCENKRSYPPQIGLADSGNTYALPLTEDQVRTIFGEPNRRGKQREIYY